MLRQARSTLKMLCFNLRLTYLANDLKNIHLHFPNDDKTDDVEEGANSCKTEGSNSRYPKFVDLKKSI